MKFNYPRPDPIRLYERYATGNYSLLEVSKKAQAEGLNYRKTGAKLHKSIVYKILTNSIYPVRKPRCLQRG